MRIIAGRHKGRNLTAPKGAATRPTSARAREGLFNMLAHGGYGPGGGEAINGAVVLDAFAGSGAFAFEALSRGAAHATLLDVSEPALGAARANAEHFGECQTTAILRMDGTHPRPSVRTHGLVFLDPPYGSGLGATALTALAAKGWIEPNAVVIAEVAGKEPFDPPRGLKLLTERNFGAARFVLMRYLGIGEDGPKTP
ncbi:MAG: RsmD family RNA methyltransferase [Alphaproteobacteria bacterium]